MTEQGSVLGPTLFHVYYRPLGRNIRKHDISCHMYMYADDDCQLCVDFSPCDRKTALVNLQRCIQEVREWPRENFVLLNDNKVKWLLLGKKALGSNCKLVNRLLAADLQQKSRMYFGF